MSPSRSCIHICAAAVLVVLWSSTVGAVGAERDHAALACADCHAGDQPRRLGSAAQEAVCTRCHVRAAVASHPTGMTPTRIPAGDLPLAADGTLACGTCHDVHERGAVRLRRSPADLCPACHEKGFFATMADGGLSLAGRGHLDASPRRWRRIDGYTLRCMACHGAAADVVGAGRGEPSGIVRIGATSHPVGIDYGAATDHGGLRPLAIAGQWLPIPDGLVSCLSCHRGYSLEHGAVRDTRDGLCATCHAL